jgi:hypothetical protein
MSLIRWDIRNKKSAGLQRIYQETFHKHQWIEV